VYEEINVDAMPHELQRRIAETFVRLPEDVADFAMYWLRFVMFDPTWRGVTYLAPVPPPQFVRTEDDLLEAIEARATAPPWERRWLVLLNIDLVADGAESEAARGTIAHEIAHAWLGHGVRSPEASPLASFEDNERAAERLATQWGFACWPSWVDADIHEKA